jgi:hypothetical protein
LFSGLLFDFGIRLGPIKVIHQIQEHLVSFSSNEVALLLDLCFAGVCSERLVAP